MVGVAGVFYARHADDTDSASSSAASSDHIVWANVEVLLGSSHLSLNENRETILLQDGFNRISAIEEIRVRARHNADERPTWEGVAERFHDADGPYWVIYPEFDRAGQWVLWLDIVPSEAEPFVRRLETEVHQRPIGVPVGAPAPAPLSYTLDMADLPSRITSDATPNDRYYQMTVGEAVTSGRPSVIVFGTPELCTRKLWNLCGATLDVFDEMAAELEGQVNFVHVEIYNLDTGLYVPAWRRYGLEVSPWIYVTDAKGRVNYRYDAIVGADELRPRLDMLLAQSGA